MTDLSILASETPSPAKTNIVERFKASCFRFVHQINTRKRLIAEFDGLSEHRLQDVGLMQADVAFLKKASLLSDVSRILGNRLKDQNARSFR